MAGGPFSKICGELVRLFHPRQDRWNEHFQWVGAELVGRINAPDFLAVREALIEERVFVLEE